MARVAGSTYADVNLGTEESPLAVALDPDRPFRILLVGDFSGRGWRDAAAPSLTPQPVDRDNIDEAMERCGVRVDLHGMNLAFRELDDFHPDRIYRAVPLFADLDRLAARAATPPPPPPAPAARAAAGGGLLDQMMAEETERTRPATAEDANDLAAFIRRVSLGSTVPRETPAQQQQQARRNALATEMMREILHHPRMQAIEAAWRAVFQLVRALDTGEDLKVYLLDLSLPEVIAHFDALRAELARKGPWGMIAGNYAFGQSELDARVLARLAGLARSAGAPFIAEARPPEGDPDPAWTQLRHSAAARWIGLALPRFLLRLPYGKDTSPVESFPFEEMPVSEHACYLWGNPAFFCAQLIGQSFLVYRWDLAKRLVRRIDGLPIHVYREDGEPTAKPCAEVLMSERDAETLLEAGFMPLASMKHQPAALIVRFQSIAEPAAALAGLA
ncbi:MAG: type VI secretion system contractile sheath large subunit [Acidobacteria bacterium]|nr:type VI secretion system contractile sheath large subunit [Acidobacteriota bacterium]